MMAQFDILIFILRYHPCIPGLVYLAGLSWSTSLEFSTFRNRGDGVDTICVRMLWVTNWINVTDVTVDTHCVCMYSVTACWVLVNADVYRCCYSEFLAWGFRCWLFVLLLFCHVLLIKNGIRPWNRALLAENLLSVDPLKEKNGSFWKGTQCGKKLQDQGEFN